MSGLIGDVTENILYFTGEPWRTCLVCKEWNGLQKRLINTALSQISEFYTSHRDPLNIRQILDDTSTPSKKLENIFLKLNKATDSSALVLPHASSKKHNARIKEIELHDLLAFWRSLPGSEIYFALPENQGLTDAEHSNNFQTWLDFQPPITKVIACKLPYKFCAKRLPHELLLLDTLKELTVHTSVLDHLPQSIYSLPNLSSISAINADYTYQAPSLPLLRIRGLIYFSFGANTIYRQDLITKALTQLDEQKHPAILKFNALTHLQKTLLLIINQNKLQKRYGEIPDIFHFGQTNIITQPHLHFLDDFELFQESLEEIQTGTHDELLTSLELFALYSTF